MAVKTKELLIMDYRKKENEEKVQKALHTIPFFSKVPKDAEIPLKLLEKLFHTITTKYAITLQWIMHTATKEGMHYYSFSFKEDVTHNHLESITAYTIYEGFAKSALFLFAQYKTGKLMTREDLAIKKQRERLKHEED